MSLTICSTPMHEIHRESVGERYCFVCRKRRQFAYTVWATIEPSYYDPSPAIRCETCDNADADLFPGHEREWDSE